MRNQDNHYYSPGQDIKFTMTTPEEEKALFVKAKAGDAVAKDFLIHNHLLFAAQLAQGMTRGALPKNEVISAANFAVMKAFNSFDPNYGVRFTTYLRKFVQGEVSQLWKSKFSGGTPDPSIAGTELRINFQLEVFVEPEVEERDLKQFNREQLAAVAATLTTKEIELLGAVYEQDKSFAEIGRARGVSREAVRASHARLLAKMKKVLVKKGVEL